MYDVILPSMYPRLIARAAAAAPERKSWEPFSLAHSGLFSATAVAVLGQDVAALR